jgi:hypothetical protein
MRLRCCPIRPWTSIIGRSNWSWIASSMSKSERWKLSLIGSGRKVSGLSNLGQQRLGWRCLSRRRVTHQSQASPKRPRRRQETQSHPAQRHRPTRASTLGSRAQLSVRLVLTVVGRKRSVTLWRRPKSKVSTLRSQSFAARSMRSLRSCVVMGSTVTRSFACTSQASTVSSRTFRLALSAKSRTSLSR